MIGLAELLKYGVARFKKDANGNTIGVGNPDGTLLSTSKRPLRTINFIGDSLTNVSQQPHIPYGVGFYFTSGQTNINSNWLYSATLDGRAAAIAGTPGVVETDGAQRMRWTYPGDVAGAWVDVSLGGFFELTSGAPAVVGHSLYVTIVQGQAAAYAPTTAKSDNLTTSGTVQTTESIPHYFPSMVQAQLGPNVTCTPYGIYGDKVSGVVGSRWQQAAQSRPDALVVLIGVNDQPGSGAAVQAQANQVIACLQKMAQYVGKIYVGGIFPTTVLSSSANQYLALYTTLLREFCATRPDVFRFWDAWSALVDPATTGYGLKTIAFHSDGLHLAPYGAYLVSLQILGLLKDDFAFPPVSLSRGFAAYEATTKKGALNSNPRLTGSAGTGSGANGVTGNVPDFWSVIRAGSTQACALSTIARADGPNAFQMQFSGATAGDTYHELSASFTLPAGVGAGNVVTFEIDVEILEATGLWIFEASMRSNGNIQSAYALQVGSNRNLSNFNSTNNAQPRLCVRAKPILLVAGVTSFTLRLRVGAGGNAGATGTIAIRRFEAIQIS